MTEVFDTQPIGQSKEVTYAMHIFNSLNRAQNCFATKDVEQFDLIISYLEAATLDDDVVAEIQVERKKLYNELMKQQKETGGTPNNNTIRFRTGFITIKRVFKYLNDILSLSNTDIASIVDSPFGDIHEQ